jgi:uncharacterized protein
MKVVVTGATGYVGRPLVAALQARGDTVTVLSRDAARARTTLGDGVTCQTANLEVDGAWTATLAGSDAVIHLAGESVAAKRWNAREKQIVRDSRIESTRVIVEAIGALPADRRPRVLVCASGVDYYPAASETTEFDDDAVTEADPPGDSFLARVCRDWESEATKATTYGVRVVCMRTGIVLGSKGGPLAKMSTPFALFVGGRLGSGQQFMSWIHLDETVAGYLAATTDERYQGGVNLVTASTRNHEFATALGRSMGKPSWLPVPGFAIKLAVGEFAEYVLRGRNVVPAKLRAHGFTWSRPSLAEALARS